MSKKYLIFIILLLSYSAYSERFEFTGKVLEIGSPESTADTSNNLSTLYVKDFKSAGSCYVANSTGHVALRVRDNENGRAQLSIALASYMSDKKLNVRVNDGNRDSSNVCYLELIRINSAY